MDDNLLNFVKIGVDKSLENKARLDRFFICILKAYDVQKMYIICNF